MSAKTRERFDRWAPTYERSFTWRLYFDPIHRIIASSIGDTSGLEILDVGCGTGGLTRRLAKGGASKVLGVDASKGMIEVARQKAKGMKNIEFREARAGNLSLPGESFDVVTCSISFHHFENPKRSLEEFFRVLKKGGRLLLCDLTGEGVGAKIMLRIGSAVSTDHHYYGREELVSMLKEAGFSIVDSRILRRFPPTLLITSEKRAKELTNSYMRLT